MTVETRYMRSDSHTINGLLAYKLGVEQTTSPLSVSLASHSYVGIRVYKRDSSGVETEIDPIGNAHAIVHYTDPPGDGYYSNTWNCPETSLNSTDAIVVRVCSGSSSSAVTTVRRTFITEQLGASKLGAATWTVYYWLGFDFEASVFYFSHGSSSYNSRIENFTWTPAVVAVPKMVGDGLTFVLITPTSLPSPPDPWEGWFMDEV